jgi:hypothetical protein
VSFVTRLGRLYDQHWPWVRWVWYGMCAYSFASNAHWGLRLGLGVIVLMNLHHAELSLEASEAREDKAWNLIARMLRGGHSGQR